MVGEGQVKVEVNHKVEEKTNVSCHFSLLPIQDEDVF